MLGACITYIKSVLALLQFAALLSKRGRVQLDDFAKLASLHFMQRHCFKDNPNPSTVYGFVFMLLNNHCGSRRTVQIHTITEQHRGRRKPFHSEKLTTQCAVLRQRIGACNIRTSVRPEIKPKPYTLKPKRPKP